MAYYKKRKFKKFKTVAEKKAFKRGLFFGLFGKNKPKKKIKSRKHNVSSSDLKQFSFLAFNDNGDCFNVHSYGTNRSDALSRAKKNLKRDPEIPCWSVTITNDKEDSNFYRHVSIGKNGSVFDNWEPHYRSSDNDIRAKYKDLSKPVSE